MKPRLSTPTIFSLLLCGTLLVQPALVQSAKAAIDPKPASEFTIKANQQVLTTLPFNDKQDFEDAQRGFIAKPETLTIQDDKGNVVWDLEQYKSYIGLDKAAPETVNPSLWRNAQLNMQYGLFKVTDKIYQIRGFDLSN
ncbi:MAG: MBL fold metallo-hydrolase, partial [Aeromonas veronii]